MGWRRSAALIVLVTTGCQGEGGTYAAACSTPLEGWGTEADGLYELRPTRQVQLASDGSLLWDRQVLSDDTLRQRMLEAYRFNPSPQVVLEIAPSADCGRVRAVRAVMDSTLLCEEGLCSEGQHPETWPLAQ
jgi:hypothetical protein